MLDRSRLARRVKTWPAPVMLAHCRASACNLLGIQKGEFAVADTAPMVSVLKVVIFNRPELAAASDRNAGRRVRGAKSYQPQVTAGSSDWRLRVGD
jgi:hypothetical protein